MLRLPSCPGTERLDDLAAEQSREMVAFSEDSEADRRTEAPDDVWYRIGVPVERWNSGSYGGHRFPDDHLAALSIRGCLCCHWREHRNGCRGLEECSPPHNELRPLPPFAGHLAGTTAPDGSTGAVAKSAGSSPVRL